MSALKVAQIPELLDMIIDYRHSDHSALAACAAVSRAWLPSSRSHRFHSLELGPQNPEVFLRLLDSPFTTIAPHVRVLTLRGIGGLVEDTLRHLTCLVGVRWLVVYSVHWGNLRVELRNALMTFKQVTRLAFWYSSFETSEGLVDVLCSYPLLEHILLCDVFWPDTPFLASTPKRLPACFRYLDLGTCSKVHVIESLFPHDCMYAMDTLSLLDIAIQELRPIAAFLRNLGHNLHHLQIHLLDITESFCDLVDLVHNDQLRSVRISRRIRGSLQRGKKDVDQVAAILSQIASDHIEVVELAVILSDSLDLIDWSSLAKALAEPQFAALRLVRVTVIGRVRKGQEVANTFRKELSDCNARGILEFPESLD